MHKIQTPEIQAPDVQSICCPNCGSPAERHRLEVHQLLKTQCRVCDYLMVTSLHTAQVVEAYYAPGAPLNQS
ncbi:MAG: replication restart DNA helicase PriA [Prochlorothrix sp.]|nr:replication restart DNA helicase PriA [Prochlorothrix sp.]